MEVFNLDIIPGKSVPVIHASQYDKGRQFRANLFERSAVYTLAGTETLNVYVRKPDGNMVTLNVTNTASDYITFKTTEQTTACDGANLCELRITKGADVIGTANFILECEKSPDTGITSQTEINNLETLVDGFTALAVADQYDSANVIFDNAPTAGHGNGYTVTSDGIKTALGTKADTSSLAAVATAGTLSSLNDTTITTPSNGQVLGYSGGKWINASVIKSANISGTTTSSGALAHGLASGSIILFATGKNVANINRFGWQRSVNDSYITVFYIDNGVMKSLTSTADVEMTVYYI